jgi:hypothetical protein
MENIDNPTSSEEGQPLKIPVKGKKPVIILVVVVILIILFSQLLYTFVIPRVTIDLKTIYHEATGGGGTGGLINVNTKIVNSGTVEARDLEVKVEVLNSTKKLLTNDTYYEDILSPGESYELKLTTNGNCFETFYIVVEVQFDTSNKDFYEKYEYKTHEDAMNIGFQDSIFEWGF